MLSNQEIDRLALQLIRHYGADLETYLGRFEWKKKQLRDAWPTRLALEKLLPSSTTEAYADAVHKWGFGPAVHPSVTAHKNYKSNLAQLCMSWRAGSNPWHNPAAMAALIGLMEISRFKIARVSKLVCFLNQQAYGIYDSRVSYALKDLLTPDGTRRVFPFVGGRSIRNGAKRYVYADSAMSDPYRAATVYVNFLRLLQRTADELNQKGGIRNAAVSQIVGSQWTPALIEIALFMAGEIRESNADIPPYCPNTNSRWHMNMSASN